MGGEDRDIEQLETAIVEAVADAEGCDPADLEPLGEVIDPDALNRLYATSREGTRDHEIDLTFTYHGYRVHVDRDGRVELGVLS